MSLQVEEVCISLLYIELVVYLFGLLDGKLVIVLYGWLDNVMSFLCLVLKFVGLCIVVFDFVGYGYFVYCVEGVSYLFWDYVLDVLMVVE